jgi:hypothetical protein
MEELQSQIILFLQWVSSNTHKAQIMQKDERSVETEGICIYYYDGQAHELNNPRY